MKTNLPTTASLHLILIALLLLLNNYGKAEESFYFQHFGVEEGLPQGTVNCILQDQQGFMWFGTKDGLSRFDGYEFRNFRHDKENQSSIGNNFIRSIFQINPKQIWIGTDAGAYIYHTGTETFEHFTLQTNEGITIEKEVNNIQATNDGNIWFAVDWQGVFKYNTSQNTLTLYKVNTIVNAWCICIDQENNVWVGTNGGGLNKYNPIYDKFEILDNGEILHDDINCLFQDNYNDLIIGTSTGVKKLNLTDNTITTLIGLTDNKQPFVRNIIRKSKQELYLATESGVYILNTQNRKVKQLKNDPSDPYSLADNAVYSLCKDREGGLWIGTYFGGLNYYPPQHTPFTRVYPKNLINTIQGKRIREFAEDQNGNIWIGSEDKGLTFYNPKDNVFKNFMPDGTTHTISYHNIHGLLADHDKLWIGTFKHGVDVMDINTQQIVKHYKKTNDPHSICDNSIFAIFKDAAGNIWLGTIYGLARYNKENDNFSKITFTGNTFIYDIFQSYDGVLWFASFNQGVFRFNPLKNEWKNFKHDINNPNSLVHDKIISIFEDSKKRIWLASEGGGMCMYNRENESFIPYSTKDGLPNDVVYKILEDNNGSLWLTTNNGLACFNPDNGFVKTYTMADGLLGNQFNYKSGLKTANGMLYFGCLNGFVAFDPATFTENQYAPPLVITGLRLFNKIIFTPHLTKNMFMKIKPYT